MTRNLTITKDADRARVVIIAGSIYEDISDSITNQVVAISEDTVVGIFVYPVDGIKFDFATSSIATFTESPFSFGMPNTDLVLLFNFNDIEPYEPTDPFYKLNLFKVTGTANLDVYINNLLANSFSSNTSGFVEVRENDSVKILVNLDSGFTSFVATTQTNITYTTSPIEFLMPNFDLFLSFDISGTYEKPITYGDKYLFERKNLFGDDFKLVIQEKDYEGSIIENKQIESINYYFNNQGTNVIKDNIIASYVDIVLKSEINDYNEFLEGDNRTFRALLYVKDLSNPFFEGYITSDTITYSIDDFNYPFGIKVRAVDGINTLNYERAIVQRWVLWTFSKSTGLYSLYGALNQTFATPRILNASCDVYELRQDLNQSSLNQTIFADSVYYRDGDEYIYENNDRILNETLPLKDSIQRMISPFIGRLFLWKNQFYFIRYAEYEKTSIRFFKFNGQDVNEFQIENNSIIDCLSDKSINNNRAFTEFTLFLKLGVLLPSTFTGLFESTFQEQDWTYNEVAKSYRLNFWNYVNSQPYLLNVSPSNQTGDVARIQWLTEGGNRCRIRNTTTQQGLLDPNLSYIGRSYTNENILFNILELDNKINIEIRYLVEKNLTSAPNIPQNASFAFAFQIGNQYLSYDNVTNEFSFSTDTNIITIPITSPVGVENSLKISGLTSPTFGMAELRIYQLVIGSPTVQHSYHLDLTKVLIGFEKNDDLNLNEIGIKAVTEKKYSSIFDRLDIYQGDVATKQSSSAITLLNGDVTSLWTRDGIEELPLINIAVKEIANRYGKPTFVLTAVTQYELEPTKKYVFEGRDWILTYSSYDIYKDEWNVELFSL